MPLLVLLLGALSLLTCGVIVVMGLRRLSPRWPEGCEQICACCRYDLTSLQGPACPECGVPLDGSTVLTRSQAARKRRALRAYAAYRISLCWLGGGLLAGVLIAFGGPRTFPLAGAILALAFISCPLLLALDLRRVHNAAGSIPYPEGLSIDGW